LGSLQLAANSIPQLTKKTHHQTNPNGWVRVRTNGNYSLFVLTLTEKLASHPIGKTQTKTNPQSLGLFWVTNVALLIINIENDATKAD
jgi:hypothetical protein